MNEWLPLFKAETNTNFLRRVVMAGYYYEGGKRFASVGEAIWGNPDGQAERWIWARGGGDVVNPLAFQDMPNFPIPKENSKYVTGKKIDNKT